MKKSWIIIGVIVLLVIIIFLSVKGTYNGLVKNDEKVNESWALVQADYQRRVDLIPNLVSTVRGYAKFEQETLIKVVEQRASATKPTINIDATKLNANTLAQVEKAQNALSADLSRLLVSVEKYPDLKASEQFKNLMVDLTGTENRIKDSRRRFGEAVNLYNTQLRSFPTNILAGMFGFEKKPYFEAQAGAENAPKVEF
jgi:LemA protein